MAWFGRTVPSTSAAVGVGMILGGAIGNLADRLFRGHHGAVVDFIYSGFWPTFNLADASIVCGCAVLALALWRANATGTSPEAEPDACPNERSGLDRSVEIPEALSGERVDRVVALLSGRTRAEVVEAHRGRRSDAFRG